VSIFAEDARDDAYAEDDEGESDKAFGEVIEPLRQSKMKLKDGDAKRGHGKGVAKGVGHAQAETAAPVALHGGDVGDCRQVIVVEAVTQPKQQARAKRRIEAQVSGQ